MLCKKHKRRQIKKYTLQYSYSIAYHIKLNAVKKLLESFERKFNREFFQYFVIVLFSIVSQDVTRQCDR